MVHLHGAREVDEVDDSTARILDLDGVMQIMPLDRQWRPNIDHSRGATPTALILSNGLSPEVDQVTLLEVELLDCEPRLGVHSSLQARPGGLLDHSLESDFADPHVMPRVASHSARQIVEHYLACGLEVLHHNWRYAGCRLIRRDASNCKEGVLGDAAFGQNGVGGQIDPFCREFVLSLVK